MKRFLKWAAIVVGVLILLLALIAGSFIGWLKWSGERDWKRAEAELRSKGEKLTFAELVPPMPSDSENFFADPLWAGYSDLVRTNCRGCDGTEHQVLVTRIPADQQPITLWRKVALSSQESAELGRIRGKSVSSEKPDRVAAYGDLRSQLRSEKSAERKKELAALTRQILSPADEVLARTTELSKRPQAQFPLRYDLIEQEGSIPDLVLGGGVVLQLSQILDMRAGCELLLGKNVKAADDVETLLRLSSIQKNEPLLISLLVRVSVTTVALKVLDQGLADHVWTSDQLALYQSLLEKIDLPKNLLFALRGERIFFRESLKGQKQFRSITWWLLNKDVAYHALLQQRALEKMEGALQAAGWNSASAHPFKDEQAALENAPFSRLMYMLVTIAIPALDGATEKAAVGQTQVNQTLIACALERYRIAHGSYPASLDVLVPEYLAKLPNSPITGKPMNYSLNADGTFLLWSPGWNLKSLGGKPGEAKGDGDIVWGKPLAKS